MQPLIEGVDFYVEDGKVVLTEKYLSERGYCCGNGCRHCPFDHINVSGLLIPDADGDIESSEN